MTSQKYICSTEDILKHASKLLKAELPVSIRLIGEYFESHLVVLIFLQV